MDFPVSAEEQSKEILGCRYVRHEEGYSNRSGCILDVIKLLKRPDLEGWLVSAMPGCSDRRREAALFVNHPRSRPRIRSLLGITPYSL